MKIFVTGTRGIPDIPGGVEKHCQELYPLIAAHGHTVIVATRTPYVTERKVSWQGVRLSHTFAPRIRSLEAIVHTFLAVIKARFISPDIVHIHAVGPGLLAPFARMLGLNVVVTNHGPDYNRQKWGQAAKLMLRLGEYLGSRFADQVIAISRVIQEIVLRRYNRTSHLIYNGVSLAKNSKNTYYLDKIGAVSGDYILAVSRFVPEKGLDVLIRAFQGLKTDHKLVIAGDTDHETEYSLRLKKMIADDDRIVPTGYITGESLNQAFSHARLFVLPSFHEGLPIALLEAMSYGLSVLVSDIPANLEVDLPAERYFQCGNVSDLQHKISALLDKEMTDIEKRNTRNRLAKDYNWSKIAEQTISVYEKAVRK